MALHFSISDYSVQNVTVLSEDSLDVFNQIRPQRTSDVTRGLSVGICWHFFIKTRLQKSYVTGSTHFSISDESARNGNCPLSKYFLEFFDKLNRRGS